MTTTKTGKRNSGPIRLGIIGLGRAGGFNPEGWQMFVGELESRKKKFRIVAACDVIKERRDRMAERYGCKTYHKAEKLVADPDVELVGIATRSLNHVKHACMALEAGKTVFLEKPIAVSYKEALTLKAASRKARGKLYFRHNRRFEPAFQHIREIMASGILGEVYEIKLRRNGYQRRGDWQTLMEFGGGQLLNWGPHIIDHGLRFLESPVADVWGDLKCVAALGDAEDHLKIILRGKNGRVVDLEISGGSAMSEPVYVVSGTRGGLKSDDEATIDLKYIDPKQALSRQRAKRGTPGTRGGSLVEQKLRWIEKSIPVNPRLKCRMDGIWDYLYDSIRKGKPFPIKMEEALQVMWVISEVRKGTPFEQ